MVSGISIQFAASVFIGYFSGDYLDGWLGTGPWLMVAGVFVGVAAGVFGIIKLLDNREPERKSPDGDA